MNVNMEVKIKLTGFGISILKEKHDELNQRIYENGGQGFGEFEIKLDEEGYYKTQLWNLMNVFGEYMTMGFIVPFDTNIIMTNGEAITA